MANAFADYLDLKVAVAEHAGNRNLSDVMDRFTLMAEAWLNQKLRAREQMTDATITFTNGVAPVPADFLEMISLFDPQGCALVAGSIADTKWPNSQYRRYAIDGSTVLMYGLNGDSRNISYYQSLPTLTTSSSTTNWLLTKYPHVYLYAVGMEAAKFLRDANLSQATSTLLTAALADMKVDDDRARWSNATVRPAMVMP